MGDHAWLWRRQEDGLMVIPDIERRRTAEESDADRVL
jgi:hypothetical protein